MKSTGITTSSRRPYLIRAMYDWVLDNGLTPHVLVDATSPDVRVPLNAVKDGHVVLNIAPRAVSQLELGNQHVRFLARFGGVSHSVQFPIEAVQAIYAHENGDGMVFPPEPRAQVSEPEAQPTLVHVGEIADAPASAHDVDTAPPPPRGKPSLRVIK